MRIITLESRAAAMLISHGTLGFESNAFSALTDAGATDADQVRSQFSAAAVRSVAKQGALRACAAQPPSFGPRPGKTCIPPRAWEGDHHDAKATRVCLARCGDRHLASSPSRIHPPPLHPHAGPKVADLTARVPAIAGVVESSDQGFDSPSDPRTPQTTTRSQTAVRKDLRVGESNLGYKVVDCGQRACEGRGSKLGKTRALRRRSKFSVARFLHLHRDNPLPRPFAPPRREREALPESRNISSAPSATPTRRTGLVAQQDNVLAYAGTV
ncbi:hypothetical protein AURDEDRAFT_126042 [Auricularia subglabra TFB-10046 SS5]|nr:hypothetical protein AURDEDRAFT_126042 [Auricularia subglabra TFB-10046 SS5]